MKPYRTLRRISAGLPLLGTALLGAMGLPAARPVLAQGLGIESARTSRVAPIALPAGAFRSTGKDDIAKFTNSLGKIAEQNKGRINGVEVLLWQNAAAKQALPGLLKNAGYGYAPEPALEVDGGKLTLFASVRDSRKSDLMGLWMEQGGAVLLAWGVFTPDGAPEKKGDARPAANEAPADAVLLQLDASATVVNVMKNAMPGMPAFPRLATKAGFVRGYVYDVKGKPLSGARLGVRSTAAGGFYSGAQGKTDAKGYYEIAVPFGAAHFYNAGYAVDYGEGRAALGLHAADGETDGLASNVGGVENFVLLPYGIADRDKAQDDPRYPGSYYGGALVLSWYVDDDPRWPDPKKLPPDAQFEVTLTPEGPLVDGSPARPIVIRKPSTHNVGFLGQLYVNNIPVGGYRIAARLVNGGPLKMKETAHGGAAFGIEPREATGAAALLLRPDSAKADSAIAQHGNWNRISISLERP